MRSNLRPRLPVSKLAAFVNSCDLICCRPRTKEEERAYLDALPEQPVYVDPADSIEISDSKLAHIERKMTIDGYTRARACHYCYATVKQFNRALKRREAAK
jgi:hypothetical protein